MTDWLTAILNCSARQKWSSVALVFVAASCFCLCSFFVLFLFEFSQLKVFAFGQKQLLTHSHPHIVS